MAGSLLAEVQQARPRDEMRDKWIEELLGHQLF